MQKLYKFISVTALATQAGHIFCCILPLIVSFLSFLVGVGAIGAVPASALAFHDVMHGWEMPILLVSGLMLLLGWFLHDYSKKLNCHDTGCSHGPCEPRKKTSVKVLKIATVLFLVNVSVYFFVHAPTDKHNHAEHGDHSGHAALLEDGHYVGDGHNH